MTDIPSDNVYAYALSKTLTKVSSPVTVGLYSECHNRINMVLKNIEGNCAHFFFFFKQLKMTNATNPSRCSPSLGDFDVSASLSPICSAYESRGKKKRR